MRAIILSGEGTRPRVPCAPPTKTKSLPPFAPVF